MINEKFLEIDFNIKFLTELFYWNFIRKSFIRLILI